MKDTSKQFPRNLAKSCYSSNKVNSNSNTNPLLEFSSSSIILTSNVVDTLKKGLAIQNQDEISMRKSSDSFSFFQISPESNRNHSTNNLKIISNMDKFCQDKEISLLNLNSQ